MKKKWGTGLNLYMRYRNGRERIFKILDKFSSEPSRYSFLMSKNEKEVFDRRVKTSKVYLEFGMGGSTFRALQKSKAKIFSVDSSPDWISQMRKYWFIKKMEKTRLFLYLANIGNTKEWGVPDGLQSKELFPAYSSGIFDQIKKESIDTVLIDGRFRLACTLKVIIECHKNDDLVIMIHDFWDRAMYHLSLPYLEEIERADTLGVFRIKKNIDISAVQKDYEMNKFDFR